MIYLWIGTYTLSFLLCWVVRRYALVKNIMDIPNDRSSHLIPKPRGGGIAFVGALLTIFPILYATGHVTSTEGNLLGAGILVALVGAWDDMAHLSMPIRLLVHFFAALCAVFCLHNIPSIPLWGELVVPSGLIVQCFAIIYLVWMLNLYNFMDGIDGLAAVEAITVCCSASYLYWLTHHVDLMILPLFLVAAVGGFLWWNFPSARLFMGDVGSGFLGLMLGMLSLQASLVDGDFFWVWLILLGVFIVDASLTLMRRIWNGCGIAAHRDHAYQHAILRYKSHKWVTLAIGALNVFWLLPIAIFVIKGWIEGIYGFVIAYIPLFCLAKVFKAGYSEKY